MAMVVNTKREWQQHKAAVAKRNARLRISGVCCEYSNLFCFHVRCPLASPHEQTADTVAVPCTVQTRAYPGTAPIGYVPECTRQAAVREWTRRDRVERKRRIA